MATSSPSFKATTPCSARASLSGGMGFVLQNRGGLFSLDPASPNILAPRKRPFHTIIPAFMEKGDQHIGFGIMGGANQPVAHAQFVSNVVDYGMNVQAALDAARFTVHPQRGCNVVIESRVAPDVRDKLTSMQHLLQVQREYSSNMGRGQAVLHDFFKEGELRWLRSPRRRQRRTRTSTSRFQVVRSGTFHI